MFMTVSLILLLVFQKMEGLNPVSEFEKNCANVRLLSIENRILEIANSCEQFLRSSTSPIFSINCNDTRRISNFFEYTFFSSLSETNRLGAVKDSKPEELHSAYITIYKCFEWFLSRRNPWKCCYHEFRLCGRNYCLKSALYRHIKSFFYDENGERLPPPINPSDHGKCYNNECPVCLEPRILPDELRLHYVIPCRHFSCLDCFTGWCEERENRELPWCVWFV